MLLPSHGSSEFIFNVNAERDGLRCVAVRKVTKWTRIGLHTFFLIVKCLRTPVVFAFLLCGTKDILRRMRAVCCSCAYCVCIVLVEGGVIPCTLYR